MEVVAMMCMIVGYDGGTGNTLIDMPSYEEAQVVGWVDYGEWVTYNLSDRSGNWAEVTDGEGETGWIEMSYLADCQ